MLEYRPLQLPEQGQHFAACVALGSFVKLEHSADDAAYFIYIWTVLFDTESYISTSHLVDRFEKGLSL